VKIWPDPIIFRKILVPLGWSRNLEIQPIVAAAFRGAVFLRPGKDSRGRAHFSLSRPAIPVFRQRQRNVSASPRRRKKLHCTLAGSNRRQRRFAQSLSADCPSAKNALQSRAANWFIRIGRVFVKIALHRAVPGQS